MLAQFYLSALIVPRGVPMQKWKFVSRVFLFVLLVTVLGTGIVTPRMEMAQAAPRRAAAGDVIISEVAWGGTAANAYDEWIELYNPKATQIDISGWNLSTVDGSPDITFPSGSIIYPGGYYLIECTDDTTILDIPADYIMPTCSSSYGLGNGGEILTLIDNSTPAVTIDTANSNDNAWDAGSGSPSYNSMERIVTFPMLPEDGSSGNAWKNGVFGNGKDANGNSINGTPHTSKIDLSLTIDLSPVPPTLPIIGDVVTLTVTVTNINNAGYATATNVKVKDTLPAGLTLDSATSPNPSPSVGTYVGGIWTVNSLAPGASATLIVKAVVGATGSRKYSAEIWSADQTDVDSTPGNASTVSEDDNASTTVIISGSPDLVVTNTAPAEAGVCNVIVYSIKVENKGADTANVTVTDTWTVDSNPVLPAGSWPATRLSFISYAAVSYDSSNKPYTNGTYNYTTGKWTGITLNSGDSATLSITVKVNSTGPGNTDSTVINAAHADLPLGQTDLNPGDNDQSSSMIIKPGNSADLEITQSWLRSSSAVDTATLSITVANYNGPDDADSVYVEDILPTGLTYVSSTFSTTGMTYNPSVGLWSVGTLALNEAKTLNITVRVNKDGESTDNTAKIKQSNQCDVVTTNNQHIQTTATGVHIADLSLLQTGNNLGTVFNITVTNAGPDDATNVRVRTKLTNYNYLSSNGSFAWDSLLGAYIWNVGTVAENTSQTLTITTTPLTNPPATNWAEIFDVREVDLDSIPGNCIVSSGAICTEDDDDNFPVLTADLEVLLEADNYNPDPEDASKTNSHIITFTIKVTNNGPNPATNVKIQDTLPTGITYISAASASTVSPITNTTAYNYTNGQWTVGTIPPGGWVELYIKAKAVYTGIFTNSASVSAVTEKDTKPLNNSASVRIVTYRALVINELAWLGTPANAEDEWIELYNPSSTDINITGWTLKMVKPADVIPGWTNQDYCQSFAPNFIALSSASNKIVKFGYYLLERFSKNATGTVVTGTNPTTTEVEDQIYYPNPPTEDFLLPDTGATLVLCDDQDNFIDTANYEGIGSTTNPWPQGGESRSGGIPTSSMERIGVSTEKDISWLANVANPRNGKDANNDNIYGTPKHQNSTEPGPTPIPPTRTPAPPLDRLIINEFLARPGYDWNQDGRVDVFDEFIEIKNIGTTNVKLNGWLIDDVEDAGSLPFSLPTTVTLKPGERAVYYGLQTNILLSDGGDTVRLINPKGKVFDTYTYFIAKVEDQSVCRMVDGTGAWYEDCIPTPALTNSREGVVPVMGDITYQSPVCSLPDTLPADFLFAECRGYGANIWRMFWDTDWLWIPDDRSKQNTFVQ
jgi:uncharacterized repeat protein (TIGR01451 family)